MKLPKIIFTIGMLAVFGSGFGAEKNDPKVDSALLHLMETYHVPVVGYAIIDHYQVVAAGTLSIDPKITVSSDSLFQAASISKSMAAYAALRLVSRGILNLDAPVNDKLSSWKIPQNDFQKNHPVTLREILSMTSGLSVNGFSGYAQEKSLPNLRQVLKGKSPANNTPIEVTYQPGSKYFYSGGGFQVLQQVIEDVEKKPFADSIKELVLNPLGMQNSHYEFPVSEKWRSKIVPAFLSDGAEIKGGWDNYAASAAAGLWSTPEDLAKFAIDVSHSFVTNRVGLLGKNDAYQMLTRQANSYFGLGVVVDGTGKNLSFRKAGHNTGYYSELLMFPGAGQGIVIMTDSENGEAIIHTLIPFVAREYNWATCTPSFDE
jgi:CubicO group peptidase (beta-lactamase class C family)